VTQGGEPNFLVPGEKVNDDKVTTGRVDADRKVFGPQRQKLDLWRFSAAFIVDPKSEWKVQTLNEVLLVRRFRELLKMLCAHLG